MQSYRVTRLMSAVIFAVAVAVIIRIVDNFNYNILVSAWNIA